MRTQIRGKLPLEILLIVGVIAALTMVDMLSSNFLNLTLNDEITLVEPDETVEPGFERVKLGEDVGQ